MPTLNQFAQNTYYVDLDGLDLHTDELNPDDDEEESDRPSTADESGIQVRKKRRFRLTHNQNQFLMDEFAIQAHPDAAHRERLAQEIPGLSSRQVQVWFQNRRAKLKRLRQNNRGSASSIGPPQGASATTAELHSSLNTTPCSTDASWTPPSHQGLVDQDKVERPVVDIGTTGFTPQMSPTALLELLMRHQGFTSTGNVAEGSSAMNSAFGTLSQSESLLITQDSSAHDGQRMAASCAGSPASHQIHFDSLHQTGSSSSNFLDHNGDLGSMTIQRPVDVQILRGMRNDNDTAYPNPGTHDCGTEASNLGSYGIRTRDELLNGSSMTSVAFHTSQMPSWPQPTTWPSAQLPNTTALVDPEAVPAGVDELPNLPAKNGNNQQAATTYSSSLDTSFLSRYRPYDYLTFQGL